MYANFDLIESMKTHLQSRQKREIFRAYNYFRFYNFSLLRYVFDTTENLTVFFGSGTVLTESCKIFDDVE